MLTTLMYLVVAWGHDELSDFIPHMIEKYLHRVKHFVTAFVAAIEGHLLLVFVYPQMYPLIHVIAKLTGFHFLDRFYYE